MESPSFREAVKNIMQSICLRKQYNLDASQSFLARSSSLKNAIQHAITENPELSSYVGSSKKSERLKLELASFILSY